MTLENNGKYLKKYFNVKIITDNHVEKIKKTIKLIPKAYSITCKSLHRAETGQGPEVMGNRFQLLSWCSIIDRATKEVGPS